VPEGDAVRRTARLLDRSLSGQVLTRSDFRVPQHATADLAGARVVETVSRGKHLLTRVRPADGPPVTLHTHLKMEGSWRVHEPGQRWRGRAQDVRVVLETDRAVAVGFSLGVVELLPGDRERDAVGHLGPDLLGADWDEDEAIRRLLEAPDRPVFDALRDQTRLAGIGTIYAAEVCFVMGVAPITSVGAVPDLPRMLRRVRQMLDQEWSMSGRVWVYRRRECGRCRTAVRADTFAEPGRERTAYWCPSCQPVRQPT
jgi:endonuclease VIII